MKLTYKASRCQNQPPQGRAGWTLEGSRCPSPREPENHSEELLMMQSGSSSRGSGSGRERAYERYFRKKRMKADYQELS